MNRSRPTAPGRRAPSLVIALVTASASLVTAGSLAVRDAAPAAAAANAPSPDFDGDGFGDVVIGAPGDDSTGGSITVLYGSSSDFVAAGSQVFTQATAGVPGTDNFGDGFGAVTAAGDFDGDGYDDVAIGVPGDVVSGRFAAGSVVVLRGSAVGLTTLGAQHWHLDRVGVGGSAQTEGIYGAALATGYFNQDAALDLAIGVPGATVNGISSAGAVSVLYGGGSGLDASGSQYFTLDTNNVPGSAGTFDAFGFSLLAQDFFGTSPQELVVGVPGDTVGGREGAGSVVVLVGGADRLTATGSQLFTQVSSGLTGTNLPSAFFGYSLAAGLLDDTFGYDLAIGAPGFATDSYEFAGAVVIVYGTVTGRLSGAGSDALTESTPGVPGRSGRWDTFGTSLAFGYVADSSFGPVTVDAYLAVGSPGDDIGGQSDAGAVFLAGVGVSGGLSGDYAMLGQGSGLPGAPAPGEQCGRTLAMNKIESSGAAFSLLVGCDLDTVAGGFAAGSLTVWKGTNEPTADPPASTQYLTQNTTGIPGVANSYDQFGSGLTGSYPEG